MTSVLTKSVLMGICTAVMATVVWRAALAEPISNPIAVFSGLDKITAVIRTFEVPVNKTVLFGTLEVTPRICNTRPPIETPKTTAFVDVKERRHGNKPKRIFFRLDVCRQSRPVRR